MKQRERERRKKVGEVVRDAKFRGGGKKIYFVSGFEGSQAVLACPSIRNTFARGWIFGKQKCEVSGCGLCYEQRREVEPGFYCI
jgi:hypothetical protein